MDFKYQLVFIINFLVCFFLMKGLSWAFTSTKRPDFLSFMLGWPYLSTRSLKIKAPPSPTSPWLSLALYTVLMSLIFALVKVYLSPVSWLDRMILGVGIYFFTEALGSLGQALFTWRKEEIYPIHHHPLSAPSVSEFWGRRWNLWVQDWIADMGRPFRRSHKSKILASFFFSGMFHEAMVNLPHYIISGESYFGTMLAYFIIQGTGLFFDKKVFRHGNPLVRRIFCWIVVILPAPLFIHVPLLRFFGMTE